jgi:hypothetical protein
LIARGLEQGIRNVRRDYIFESLDHAATHARNPAIPIKLRIAPLFAAVAEVTVAQLHGYGRQVSAGGGTQKIRAVLEAKLMSYDS